MTSSHELDPVLAPQEGRRKALGAGLLGFIGGLVLTFGTIAGPSGRLHAETNAGKVRIVNLYRRADGKPGALDVYLGAGSPGATTTVTLSFGQASEYLTVPTLPSHLLFYPTGQRTEHSRLFDLNMQEEVGPGTPVSVGGEQVTVVVTAATKESPGAAVSVVREWSSSRFALYAPKPGIAIVVGWSGGVQAADQQPPAFRLGAPSSSCMGLIPGILILSLCQFPILSNAS